MSRRVLSGLVLVILGIACVGSLTTKNDRGHEAIDALDGIAALPAVAGALLTLPLGIVLLVSGALRKRKLVVPDDLEQPPEQQSR